MAHYAELSPDSPPVLMVVVDTEEEFDWGKPFNRASVGVEAISSQNRMHEIFKKYGIVPTYVVDYPVATTPTSRDYLLRLHEKGLCEIGAHLHPWVNPPYEEVVCPRNSFPGNLPPELERRKLEALTESIFKNFNLQPRVYRAGRYGLGGNTISILEDLGYDIDTSVAPNTSFAPIEGPDFRSYPDRPHFVGKSRRILEVPLTIGFAGALASSSDMLFATISSELGRNLHLPGLFARSGLLERISLTPEGVDLAALIRLTKSLIKQGQRIFSFCYHSPSLQVGNTPYVRTEERLLNFLATSDAYFKFFAEEVGGRFTTMTSLHQALSPARPPVPEIKSCLLVN